MLFIAEFTTYVFQLMALLMEVNKGQSQITTALLPVIVRPELWNNQGNIPPLIRLLQVMMV